MLKLSNDRLLLLRIEICEGKIENLLEYSIVFCFPTGIQILFIMPKTCVEAAKVQSLINAYVMGQSKTPIIKEKKIELWGPHN